MKYIFLFISFLSINSFSDFSISNGKLIQRVQYKGKDSGFKESLEVLSSSSIKSMECKFKIEKLNCKNLTADIILEFLYQDPTEKKNSNLKIIRLHIRDKGSSPTLKGTSIECHNEDCESYYKSEINEAPFNLPIDIKDVNQFKITVNKNDSTFTLKFNNSERILNFTNNFNLDNFKTARLGLSIKNHKKLNSKGKINVLWDDILINEIPFDNFNNSQLDLNKWQINYKKYDELY